MYGNAFHIWFYFQIKIHSYLDFLKLPFGFTFEWVWELSISGLNNSFSLASWNFDWDPGSLSTHANYVVFVVN